MTHIIPQLTSYQYGLLCHTAQASSPIFLIPKPLPNDKAAQRYKLISRNKEVRALVGIGLLEDVSQEFKDSIDEQLAQTGRKFKVYGMTETGYLLFSDCEKRPVN